jgi:hypothetical protein
VGETSPIPGQKGPPLLRGGWARLRCCEMQFGDEYDADLPELDTYNLIAVAADEA